MVVKHGPHSTLQLGHTRNGVVVSLQHIFKHRCVVAQCTPSLGREGETSRYLHHFKHKQSHYWTPPAITAPPAQPVVRSMTTFPYTGPHGSWWKCIVIEHAQE